MFVLSVLMRNILKKVNADVFTGRSFSAFIVGIGLALLLGLVLLRTIILKTELAGVELLGAIHAMVSASSQDVRLACFLTIVIFAASQVMTRRTSQKLLAISFFVVALLILLWGAANLEIVQLLGEPFTLSWLYYSDFLGGTAINAIGLSTIFGAFLLALLILPGFALCSAICGVLVSRIGKFKTLLGVFGVAAPIFLLLTFVENPEIPRAKTLNPVVAFGLSILFPQELDLLGSPQRIDDFEGLRIVENPPEFKKSARSESSTINNVIFFVLESAPAEYLQNYGGAYPVTPNMLKYAPSALKFERIYAHAPATNYSLVSLLTSIYPEVSSKSMTQQYPDFPLDSIGNVLSANGYRTGFFNSSDNRFQSSDVFLSKKGFHIIEDYRSRTCEAEIYRNSSQQWQYLDFSSDLCTVKSLTKWIESQPNKPFFAVMWTGMTHYPYFTEGVVKQHASDPGLNRYLNALRSGDKAFGNLMRFLVEKDLAESTLVVVLGDHGEAFGRHGTFVHASAIFEENVHIPLLLFNPQLFSGDKSDVLGGIYDIAPSVLDILRIPAPHKWQGRSLFASRRPERIFFFAPWNGFQVGFRQGERKFIYHADKQQMQIFDLSTDPGEKQNLASQDDQVTAQAKRQLAAWVQFQNNYIDNILNGAQDSAPTLSPSVNKTALKLTVYASGTSYKTSPRAQVLADGSSIGYFAVTAAPTNSEHSIEESEIEAALTPFEFFLGKDICPKRIEVRFLNDEWAGEGKTGDTNLFVKSISINGVNFSPDQLQIDTPEAGRLYSDYMGLWRNGSLHIDLTSKSICG